MREHEGERERVCVRVCLRDVKGILTIDNTSEMVFARLLGHFFECSSLSKISVLGWTSLRCEM